MTTPAPTTKPSSWPISIGAEGIAAAQFARCGFDVLVQSGRDKPWYDFAVTRAGNLMKVSVKASDDGRWNLPQSFARRGPELGGRNIDCRSAIDFWMDSQGTKTICCLVQFEGVAINLLPRIYLAFPNEIAAEMRIASERTGQCALHELYEWTTSEGRLEVGSLPSNWRFSPERIHELIERQSAPLPATRMPSKSIAITSVPSIPPRAERLSKIALSA
jgi:hypothetical protein